MSQRYFWALLQVAHPLCRDWILILGENRFLVSRTDTPSRVCKEVVTPHTALRTSVLSLNGGALSIRGAEFHLTRSRVNSFPSGFYFICLSVNFISGQAGNVTLPFLSSSSSIFSDGHFSYSHVDSFKLAPRVCASRRESPPLLTVLCPSCRWHEGQPTLAGL